MQLTLNLPDNLSLTEADLRQEVAIALFQQKVLLIEQAAEVIGIDVDDFYQILVDRNLITPPADPDDTPIEEIREGLSQGWQDILAGRTKPVSQLWQGLDVD